MSPELADRTCLPCRGGVPPLTPAEIAPLARALPDWTVEDHARLSRTFEFPDWAGAAAFVQQAGEIAEEQGHHPDLHLSWGRVRAEIYTHKIDGLAEADFILAAKYSRLYGERFAR